jgi:drug/metabolite transporter (DMT)-like permease
MVAAAYAAIYLIWGSTYLAISLAVHSIPPLLMMGLRCTAAGGLLLLWALIRREPAALRHWGHSALAGLLMFSAAYGGLAWAEQQVASGVAALLSATTPFWMVAFEWSGGSRPNARTIAGLIIGLAGVALLVGLGSPQPMHAAPIIAILAGTGTWAAGSLYARPPRVPCSVALASGMSLAAGGACLLLASWGTHELAGFDLHAVSRGSAAALAYLVVFGSLVGFIAYGWILRVAPPARVATYAYVNPLVAMGLGAGLAGEQLSASVLSGGLVIAAGVAITLAGRSSHLAQGAHADA